MSKIYLHADTLVRVDVLSSNVPALWGNITLTSGVYAANYPTCTVSLVNGESSMIIRHPLFSVGESTNKIVFNGIEYIGEITRV